MSAKQLSKDHKHIVIRPLVYVEEKIIQEFSSRQEFPIVCCSCPVAEADNQKRQQMKQIIKELSQNIPEIRNSLINAIGNVQSDYLLDRQLTKENR